MSTDKAMVTDEMVDAAVSALDITVYGKDTKEKMRKAISAAIYANRSCGGFSSAALAQAEQPVAWGVFRDGQMIGWVPGPDEDAEFKLPEDTDERRPLYAHPPAKREAGEAAAPESHLMGGTAEQERLRFEGDLDKWMKIIGAGITGYQPEAYALMDLACEELVRLRKAFASLDWYWPEDDTSSDACADGPWQIAENCDVKPGEVFGYSRGGVVETRYYGFLEAAEDADSDDQFEADEPTREAAEAKIAAELQRRAVLATTEGSDNG